MLNKVYNIIIYSHIVVNMLKDKYHNKKLPVEYKFEFDEGSKIYLSDKVKRYLGSKITFYEIDHSKLICVWFEQPYPNSLGEMIEFFTPMLDIISENKQLFPDEYENGILKSEFKIAGIHLQLADEIRSFIENYDDKWWNEYIRDLKIKSIVKNEV